ncbi:hypothetical protein M9Y10_003430 [Tritrichomonas musculus]|uniref:Ankyrin n=1 Tax=Tritrichomonas musculus TaxID=1915356 RepID=A0ABR2JQK8_9EUKA
MNGSIGEKNYLNHFLNNKVTKESEDKMKTISSKEETPLLVAIETGNKEIVNLLLSNTNIDVNQKLKFTKSTKYNEKIINEVKTFLSVAVESGNKDIVELLINTSDIDVNIKCINAIRIASKDDYDEDIIFDHYRDAIESYFIFYEGRIFCGYGYDFEITIFFYFYYIFNIIFCK